MAMLHSHHPQCAYNASAVPVTTIHCSFDILNMKAHSVSTPTSITEFSFSQLLLMNRTSTWSQHYLQTKLHNYLICSIFFPRPLFTIPYFRTDRKLFNAHSILSKSNTNYLFFLSISDFVVSNIKLIGAIDSYANFYVRFYDLSFYIFMGQILQWEIKASFSSITNSLLWIFLLLYFLLFYTVLIVSIYLIIFSIYFITPSPSQSCHPPYPGNFKFISQKKNQIE